MSRSESGHQRTDHDHCHRPACPADQHRSTVCLRWPRHVTGVSDPARRGPGQHGTDNLRKLEHTTQTSPNQRHVYAMQIEFSGQLPRGIFTGRARGVNPCCYRDKRNVHAQPVQTPVTRRRGRDQGRTSTEAVKSTSLWTGSATSTQLSTGGHRSARLSTFGRQAQGHPPTGSCARQVRATSRQTRFIHRTRQALLRPPRSIEVIKTVRVNSRVGGNR